jgi:putative nucleotidyltransferase with HDIG domain
MSARLDKLEAKVGDLYQRAKPDARADWVEWLAKNHVWVVADNATALAEKHGGNPELARAAALLHDIADVRLSRRGPEHFAESLKLARELMAEAGFGASEIKLTVDDAIRFHSCHGEERPESVEGKILATADSMAHLATDFYIHATWAFGGEKTLEQVKAWTLEKIERDLNVKMFFDEVREELRPSYNLLKELYSR